MKLRATPSTQNVIFKLAAFVTMFFFFIGCQSQPCKIEDRKDNVVPVSAIKNSTEQKDMSKKVFIFKPDGSLQCGQGEKIDPNIMKKDLGDIEVFSMLNKHDGLMRVQLCGHPTGYCNVFQINQSDLEKAQKLGFKKWLKD